MAAQFNVAIIQPPGYAHSQALSEVWIYLTDVLQRCGYEAKASINTLMPDAHNVLLCGHLLPAKMLSQIPLNTIVVNSEKLEQSDGWYLANGNYSQLIKSFTVWDYSARNLAHVPHDRKAQIPLYYASALKKPQPRDADGPLLFYGCITPRRADILNGLQKAGVPIAVAPFGCYGDARDQLMYQASAVLNLHTDAERKVFEPVRCFHPLINGIPVITEEFHDEPMFDAFRRSMFVVPSDDPATHIAKLLADRTTFRSVGALHTQTFAVTDPLPDVRRAVESYLASLNPATSAVVA